MTKTPEYGVATTPLAYIYIAGRKRKDPALAAEFF
jgi:hypothetical protein